MRCPRCGQDTMIGTVCQNCGYIELDQMEYADEYYIEICGGGSH